MSNVQTVFVAAILMGLAGCATAPAKESTAFDCAPKGYERMDGWELRDQRTGIATATDTGEPIRITSIGRSRGAETLTLTFVGNVLILVDPKPEDDSVPLLGNVNHITADNKLRTQPLSGPCEWRPLLTGDQPV